MSVVSLPDKSGSGTLFMKGCAGSCRPVPTRAAVVAAANAAPPPESLGAEGRTWVLLVRDQLEPKGFNQLSCRRGADLPAASRGRGRAHVPRYPTDRFDSRPPAAAAGRRYSKANPASSASASDAVVSGGPGREFHPQVCGRSPQAAAWCWFPTGIFQYAVRRDGHLSMHVGV